MKPPKSPNSCHSFQDIKDLLQDHSVSLPKDHSVPQTKTEPVIENEALENEGDLFSKAMEDVTPLTRDNRIEPVIEVKLPEGSRIREDAEALLRLTDLIQHGTGFNVFDTPEYIEGTGYNVHPEIARRLHRGDFSIQAHLDLHGLTAEDAREAFETFLKGAVITGKRGVLIVHGRGLSSPSEPVLKKKVVEWLTLGPWRKWVIAYSSARVCDGGAGATYVLLRQRAISKRGKVRHKRKFSTFFR